MLYDILWEKDHFIVKFHGKLLIGDILQANDSWQNHKDFDSFKYQIWDLTKSDVSNISIKDTQIPAYINKVISGYKPKMKGAIVLRDPYAIELALHYVEKVKELGITWDICIFDNLHDAVTWTKDN